MSDFYETIRSLWVLWLMAVFIGIVAWAYWPGNRQKFEKRAMIPLDDDDRGGV